MSALSDDYIKNFNKERKAEFNRRFREDYDAAMSERSNIIRILGEMRELGLADGGRIGLKEGLGSFETNDPGEAMKEIIDRIINKNFQKTGGGTIPISDNISLNLGPSVDQAELGGIINLLGGELMFGGGFKGDDKGIGISFKKEFNKGGRVAYQDGTPERKNYETPVTDVIKSVNNKTMDLASQAVDAFDKYSGIDQINPSNFPGMNDSAIGAPSDFRHQAAANALAEALGKGKVGPVGYLSGGIGSFGLGTIKEIGDLFAGLVDKNTTAKDAFSQAYEDTISNFKGAFAPTGTTSEELYSEIMKDYVPNNRFDLMPFRSRSFLKQQKQFKDKQALDILEKARAAKTAQAAAQAQTRAMAAKNRSEGRGGFQSDFAQDKGFMSGKGTAAEMGSFAKGGLARMLGE